MNGTSIQELTVCINYSERIRGKSIMSKIAVIYWSSTGNTEAMANAVVEGASL